MDATDERAEVVRPRIERAVALAAGVGLLIGLLAGWMVVATRADTYVTATTFGVVPAGDPVEQGVSTRLDPGQLAFLTPVVSSVVTDPATIDRVEGVLGRDPGVVYAPSLIADSPLLFRVEVRADTPEWAAEAAHAMEEVLPTTDKARGILEDSRAQLIVTASASEPSTNQVVPTAVTVLATGLAGALIGAGMVLGVGRYRARI